MAESPGHWRSWNRGEIGAALVIVGLGAFMVWESTSYPIGSLSRMGPGFFPLWLGIALMGLGAAVVLEAADLDLPLPEIPQRPFIMVTAGLIAFALLVGRLGLVPATVVLVVLSALADRPVRPRAIVGTALVVAAIAYFVFIRAFSLPLDAFAW